jgi:RNA polymerase sigma-70 factor, ECF subfamily
MGQNYESAGPQDQVITGLVQKAIKGDVEAYGQLYGLCLNRIYRYVFSRVKNVMQAEDITEEVFIRAWKAIKSCQGKESTFIPWLYHIAHNYLVDVWRKNSREVSYENLDLADDCDPEKEADNNIELQKVLEAVKNLPEPQRRVILLKFMDEIDTDEIGRILGKRQGAVRALQMRALISLREKFNCGVGNHGR